MVTIDTVLEYIIAYVPAIVALIAECGIVKYALSTLAKAKESAELKKLLSQNNQLLQELRESRRLNNELLTKIDRIDRSKTKKEVRDNNEQ